MLGSVVNENLGVIRMPESDRFPSSKVVEQLSIRQRFLLEGACSLGGHKVSFINLYNSVVFDSICPERRERSSVFTYDLESQELSALDLPSGLCASAILPTTDLETQLLVTNQGLYLLTRGELTLWHRPNFIDSWPEGTRPNDSRVDPEGNLLLSWMGEGQHRDSPGSRQGELWLIRPDKSEQLLLQDIYIPNGHAFIPNGDGTYRMFFNDSARNIKNSDLSRGVDEYLYDPSKGLLTRVGGFFNFPGGNSVNEFPDGMAISADNRYLLVAMFLGSGVDVIDIAERRLLGRIRTPLAAQTTSLAILPDGETLITTASEGYVEADFISNPNGGSIFTVSLGEIGIFGAPPARFKLIS